VLAVELLTAARALDLRKPLTPAAGTGAVQALVRAHVDGVTADRYLSPEIETARTLICDGSALAAAEGAVGVLE
jgi:histidine ammonia-lyase